MRCTAEFALESKGTMNNILVGNLSPDATEQDIRSMFEKYGAVERSKIMIDPKTDQSRGFGFVEMTDDREAENAIAVMNGEVQNGRVLSLNAARPQLHRCARKKR